MNSQDLDQLDRALARLPQAINDPERDDAVWAGIASQLAAPDTAQHRDQDGRQHRRQNLAAKRRTAWRMATAMAASVAVAMLVVLATFRLDDATLELASEPANDPVSDPVSNPADDILVASGSQDDRSFAALQAWETIPASYRAAEQEVLADLPTDARNRAAREQDVRALEQRSAQLRAQLRRQPNDVALIDALLATEHQRLTLIQTMARQIRRAALDNRGEHPHEPHQFNEYTESGNPTPGNDHAF